MNRRSIGIVTVAAWVFVTLAMAADDQFVGTWKLKAEKSTGIGTPPKSQILTVETISNGLKFESDAISSDGKARHSQWTQIFNGEFRPDVAIPEREVAYTRIDANTIERVIKENGKEVGRGRSVISHDGKTMILIQKGKNAQEQEVESTTVYERR
jgi:hypothetical protein